MRTSRISKETSRAVTTGDFLPRRSTRSSLSRFALDTPDTPSTGTVTRTSTITPDIEDAIAPPPRKRRRVSPDAGTVSKGSPRKPVTVKTETTDTIAFVPSPRKARKPARKIKDEDTGEVVIHAPSSWHTMYDIVKEMRTSGAAQNAAVDTMGCDSLAEDKASPLDKRFHTLVALMLSSQTKDTTNAVAMKRLQTQLPPYKEGAPIGLNLDNILAVEPTLLNELIWIVGFHNNKTRYIKAAAEILRDVWSGDIPDTIEGLMSLPGVGPKMAYLCMSSAWGRTEGIGVDVHVHRITNLWGWHGKPTKGPEETRIALQSWLPKELWHEINHLLVGFGQTICLPVGRKCGQCELGLQGLCRAAEKGKVIAGRKTKVEMLVKDEADKVVAKVEEVKKEEDGKEVAFPKDVLVESAGGAQQKVGTPRQDLDAVL